MTWELLAQVRKFFPQLTVEATGCKHMFNGGRVIEYSVPSQSDTVLLSAMMVDLYRSGVAGEEEKLKQLSLMLKCTPEKT